MCVCVPRPWSRIKKLARRREATGQKKKNSKAKIKDKRAESESEPGKGKGKGKASKRRHTACACFWGWVWKQRQPGLCSLLLSLPLALPLSVCFSCGTPHSLKQPLMMIFIVFNLRRIFVAFHLKLKLCCCFKWEMKLFVWNAWSMQINYKFAVDLSKILNRPMPTYYVYAWGFSSILYKIFKYKT